MEDRIEPIGREFLVTENWIYLNQAAVAPLCRPAASAMRDFEERRTVSLQSWRMVYDKTRRVGARLIGSWPEEIARLKNISEGPITVTLGL